MNSVDYQDVLGHRLVLASLSNKIMPQFTLGCKTIVWTLWTGHRALRT
uniref:Uncharacterized protein n=1 Tax=Heterorhabditis bacteriophora TaxID=37862 RepID=A0A1I7X3J9_HETBA